MAWACFGCGKRNLQVCKSRTGGWACTSHENPASVKFPAKRGWLFGMAWVFHGSGLLIISTEKQRSEFPSQSLNPKGRKKIVGIGYNSNDLLPWRLSWVPNTFTRAITSWMPSQAKIWLVWKSIVCVALFPCKCAKLVIQASIKEVIPMSDKYHDSDETTSVRLIFNMAGFTSRKFTPKYRKTFTDFDSINSRRSQKILWATSR